MMKLVGAHFHLLRLLKLKLSPQYASAQTCCHISQFTQQERKPTKNGHASKATEYNRLFDWQSHLFLKNHAIQREAKTPNPNTHRTTLHSHNTGPPNRSNIPIYRYIAIWKSHHRNIGSRQQPLETGCNRNTVQP